MIDVDHYQRSGTRSDYLVRSLNRETARFEEATMAGQPLEKHHSQVASLVQMLKTSLDDLERLPDANLPELVLDLHHVWDFFRSKLILRCLPQYRGFLDTADELAWACYAPALREAGVSAPVPPLVFPNRALVPFAVARGSDYRELLPSGVRTRSGAKAVQQLPFPIIGVPWYQTEHLPGLLAVAHEAGHHIEDDCKLKAALKARLRESGLSSERQTVWQRWLAEVFGDICACLACGPAYIETLSDALAAAPPPAVGTYPPPHLRLEVCRMVLEPPGEDPSDEAAVVVRALTTGGYPEFGGKALPAVLGCTEALNLDVPVGKLLVGMPSETRDVRSALAAAAIAFLQDPAGYDKQHVGQNVTQEILDLRPFGVRRAQPADADRATVAGHALAHLLSEHRPG
ncbi:hypothetical protein [Streptomyces doebereineriae]|uniref:Uncharacterized protein n=1 Tax=Streptomyces doebereineriae TaxID=3075528 RepID=A0ABU2V3N1_9ACTN|nr:hypothetical protein [Streptomyces sp. DSM 41640]MDT0479746.1 hypothetical protein [Streptomyces sp. DSM 41640]